MTNPNKIQTPGPLNLKSGALPTKLSGAGDRTGLTVTTYNVIT